MSNIVNTYNLFVDTSQGRSSSNPGDDYTVNLQSASILAGSGQYIRISLNNFSMNKCFPQVNGTNNEFSLQYLNQGGGVVNGVTRTFTIPVGTYTDATLVNTFAASVQTALASVVNVPATVTGSIVNDKMVLSITHGTDADHSVKITPLNAHDNGLLGGAQGKQFITGFDNTAPLLLNTVMTVTSNYPMLPADHSTMSNIYVRLPGTTQTGLETLSLTETNPVKAHEVQIGDILAEIPVNEVAFNDTLYYNAPSDRIYFANLKQKSLEQLRLRLTNNRNQLLPKFDTEQAVFGNMHFSCNLRIDIIQEKQIDELETVKVQPSFPPRFNTVLKVNKHGEDTFGKGPGF